MSEREARNTTGGGYEGVVQSHAALRQARRGVVPDRTVGLSQVAARNAELHSSGIERHVRRGLRRALQRVQQAAIAALTRRVAEPNENRRLDKARDAGGAEVQACMGRSRHGFGAAAISSNSSSSRWLHIEGSSAEDVSGIATAGPNVSAEIAHCLHRLLPHHLCASRAVQQHQ